MNQTDRIADRGELPAHLQTIGAGLDFTDPHSPLAPYYLRTSDVLAAVFLAAVFFFLNYVPLWHTDIWGHLKYGQWMVQHQRLPEKDMLCVFADPNANSLHVYWLCQTGYYLVYHTGAWLAGGDALQQMEGGVELLRALHAMFEVARCLLLLLALRRLGCPNVLACVGLFLMLFLSSQVMRPQEVGQFFLACVLLAVSRKELSRRALLILPVVLVLWANSHGSFVLGLAVLACCLLGETIQAVLVQRSFRPRALIQQPQIKRLSLVLFSSAIAVAIFNPHGPYIYSITFAMSRNPNVNAMDEWQPISLLHPNTVSAIYIATIVLLIGTQILSRHWFSPVQWVLLIGFGVQPLLHQRMMVWWLMLLLMLLPTLATALERLPYYGQPQPDVPSFRKTILAGLLIVIFALWSPPGQWLVTGKTWPLPQAVSQGTPWQLAQDLIQPGEAKEEWGKTLAQGLEAYPNKQYRGLIFASETLGDYFAWSLPQETMPIVIDTHVHLFAPDHWKYVYWVKCGGIKGLENVNLVVVEAESHPLLRNEIKERPAEWLVVNDETGSAQKLDSRCRLFVALRKKPK
jgi:hypothetical protein